jgi:hypothetical protein
MADDTSAQPELQQELQRFASELTDRVVQALSILASGHGLRIRREALGAALRYASAALEIATGPVDVVNLLDMFVFVRLCRDSLERHWIPKVYGEQGRPLGDVFSGAEVRISAVVERTLDPKQRQQLEEIVGEWLEQNPGQFRVEGIRLADFSALTVRSNAVRGLLSSVKSATKAANQALLLSERGLFLIHRLPFLWRLQTRLGAQEILSDTLSLMTTPFTKARSIVRNIGKGFIRVLRKQNGSPRFERVFCRLGVPVHTGSSSTHPRVATLWRTRTLRS